MTNNTTLTSKQTVKPKGSITGFVLALVSLALAGIGTGLVHAHYTPAGPPATNTATKVSADVASGTGHVISSLIAVPFLVIGFAVGALAVIFVLVRLRKGLKASALFFSLISILICIWSFTLVVGAFSLLKAHS